jgi:NAD(P)-dependent dehydrogenase (short-subunit alcohol dehydrogenase family)
MTDSTPGPVLITGCSTGIGRAAALALAAAGIPVWASARRVETLDDLAAAGCRTVRLDVTDEESCVQAVKTVQEEHGAIGALVNNAGYGQFGPVEEVPIDALRRQFETNLFGLVRMCQLVLPGMRQRGSGTIVNVGSAAGLIGMPGSGAYSMTKWALEVCSDALRNEVAGFGVRVVLLEPGGVRTSFTDTESAIWPTEPGPYDAFKAAYRQRMHSGARGMSTVEDVAGVVVRAITARRPKARYKIGVTPRVMPILYRALPNRAWDALVRRMLPTE